MFSIAENLYSYLIDFNKFAINEWRKLSQNERITALTLAVFSLYIGFTLIYKLHKFYQSQTFSNTENFKVQKVAFNILDQPPNAPAQHEITKPLEQVESLSNETVKQPSDPFKDVLLSKKELLNDLISALTLLGSPEDLEQAEKLCRLKDNPDDADITSQNVLSVLDVSNKIVDWKDPKIIKLLKIKEFILFALMSYDCFGTACFEHAPFYLRENKQFVLQALDLDQNIFAHLHYEFLNDMDIVVAYLHKCSKDETYYPIAPLKNDKAFLLKLMSKTTLPLSFLIPSSNYFRPFLFDETLISDFDFSLAALKNNPKMLLMGLVHSPLIENKEWVLQASAILGKASPTLLCWVKDPLKNDLEVILACLKETPNYSPNDFSINDEKLLSQLIEINGLFLQLAHKDKCTSFELVLAAVKKDGRALKWASSDLQANKTIALAAVRSHPLAFHYVSATLKEELNDDPYFKKGLLISANKKQMIDYIRQDHHNFECAAENLRMNPDVLLECIKENNELARQQPSHMFKDKKFITELSKIIPWNNQAYIFNFALEYDPEAFLNIIERGHVESFYLPQYIKRNYYRETTKFRSEEKIKALFDKQTILRAIQLKPLFYIFLNDSFFNDPEVALAAIKEDRNLIHEISPSLYKDKVFALEALKLNKFFFYLMDDDLKNTPEIIAAFQAT